jgi:lysophospholipase L1-like esterase
MKINKLKSVVFIVSIAFIILNGCARKEIRNINSSGKNIICFGDSLTFGYGAQPGEDYPAALGRLFGVPVINAGIDGDTTTDALKRIKNDVLDKQPLLVIVEFGGNDFLRKVPLEITTKNLEEIVERIQAEGAMVAIVDISTGFFLKEYRRPLYILARRYKAIFIPNALKGIITSPGLKSDFIHPNAKGYKIIARRIYCVISAYLGKSFFSHQRE